MKPEDMLHNAPKAPPRQAKPGAEVWRLRDDTGRVQSCELRDNSRAGAGWEVQILEPGEILVSPSVCERTGSAIRRRCRA